MAITSTAIEDAFDLIRPHVRTTPILALQAGSFGLDFPINAKLELFQHSGSFKARGAFNTLLSRDIPLAGVAAASGGNHGAAVAYAAQALDIPANIFVPSIASPAKLQKIRDYGATIHIGGDLYADALERCKSFQAETGAVDIHAYDAEATIAGQGTVGLEWEAQTKGLDTILIAVGGGGLVSGIGTWFGGRTKVIAVEPEGSCSLYQARKAGRPVDVQINSVAADSLGAGRCGDLPFAIAKERVDECILVSDEQILNAQRLLWNDVRLATEPGAATALAAILSGAYKPERAERIGVLICGGNVNLATLSGQV